MFWEVDTKTVVTLGRLETMAPNTVRGSRSMTVGVSEGRFGCHERDNYDVISKGRMSALSLHEKMSLM